MFTFRSTYMQKVFTKRSVELDKDIQRVVNKARVQNYLAVYNALRSQCEFEYDTFMIRMLKCGRIFLNISVIEHIPIRDGGYH